MNTLLLTRTQVESLLDPLAITPALRDGFIRYSKSRADRALRIRSNLPGPGTATVLFPGTLPGMPVYTVKIHAKFPEQKPAIRGALCLHSVETGDLLAIMDSTHLTAVRTGLAGALAAHVLARPGADTVAIVGAGVQGRQQLSGLATLRPLRRVWVFDQVPAVAQTFSAQMSAALNIPIDVALSIGDAVRTAGIILMATWSRTPLLLPGMLAPGAHVTTLGADEPSKIEVSGDVIRTSLFIADDSELAAEMGALRGAGLSREFAAAELGDVLGHTHPGRTSGDQITIYGGVGLAFQDAVCAWAVYQSALNQGIGQRINFLS